MPFVTLFAECETDGLWVAKTGNERDSMTTAIANFKYLAMGILYMEDRKEKMEEFVRKHRKFFEKLAKSI